MPISPYDGYTAGSNWIGANQPVVVTNVAALRLLDKTKVGYAVTKGYYTAGDGGAGEYWYDGSDTTSNDNGGSIIKASDAGLWKLVVGLKVNVLTFGAKGDGATDDSLAFSRAAAYAENSRLNLSAPKPATSYLLTSSPTIPANVNIETSPDWFSGAGTIPAHAFILISEGVDPRGFAVKSLNYSETSVNETKRKWAVVGWVNYKNAPAHPGTTTDAVGVDGRAVCDAFNGRVWGLLGLAHMTPNAYNGSDPGVSQAYACELDINNNSGHDVQSFDSAPVTRGLAVVSGGTNRPGEALYVLATRRPADPPSDDGDNRWWCGLRFYRDSVHPAGYLIHIDDENQAMFARIPVGSSGIRWTDHEAINYTEYQDRNNKRRIMWSQTPGYGYDFVDSFGNVLFGTNDKNTCFQQPMRRSVKTGALPTAIDSSLSDIFVITSPGTISGGISNALDGQKLSIVNVSGGTVTLARSSNMRTAGGSSVVINNLCCAEFICSYPTWFQLNSTTNA